MTPAKRSSRKEPPSEEKADDRATLDSPGDGRAAPQAWRHRGGRIDAQAGRGRRPTSDVVPDGPIAKRKDKMAEKAARRERRAATG
jgi:hypothetical protein